MSADNDIYIHGRVAKRPQKKSLLNQGLRRSLKPVIQWAWESWKGESGSVAGASGMGGGGGGVYDANSSHPSSTICLSRLLFVPLVSRLENISGGGRRLWFNVSQDYISECEINWNYKTSEMIVLKAERLLDRAVVYTPGKGFMIKIT